MRQRSGLFLLLVLALALPACLVIENSFTGIAPGPWRAVLRLEPNPVTPNPKGEPLPEKMNLEFDEVTEGQLPFTFEVVYDNDTLFHWVIQNGEERIRLDDIRYTKGKGVPQDTIVVSFPVFGTYIQALHEDGVIEGKWYDPTRSPTYAIPFIATQGENHRFTQLKKEPLMNISGRWEVTFSPGTDEVYPAVGLFEQNGNQLTGTFLTETGDYRYLAGTVQADKLYLSAFDGAHAFLFEAKIRPDSTIVGSFRSGTHYRTTWEARPNADYELRDPHDLTTFKEEYETLDFSFPSPDGSMISPGDEPFAGKVRIIQILGTWCPNCRDETAFLRDFLAEHAHPDLAVIGLAFERYQDQEKAFTAIRNYQTQMKIDYPLLLAGPADKEAASRALPMLSEVIAFPTLVILDRQGQVRRIHTGFSGPATNEYQKFKTNFKAYIQELLDEQ